MKAITRIVLGTVMYLTVAQTHGQTNKYHFEGGINLGTLLYQGDLVQSPAGSFKGAKPMVQLWLGKPFTPYLSWRANLTMGSLSADESQFATPFWKQLRNFSFQTPVTELSGMLQLNLYGDNGKETYHTLTPYLMAGAGLGFLNVQRDWSRLDTTAFNYKSLSQNGLAIDSQHVLPRVLPLIPVGAGLRWMVTPRLALNAEVMMRFSFSDYIDGFSYAADPKRKDSYYGLSLGMSFVFGGDGVKCPRIQK
jgi:hypothetical protein